MYCSISGEIPEEPVVSKKTGHIYEKRLILKYINAEGKCPVSGEPLDETDIVDIVMNKIVRPRPAVATSIPGMLALMQNEWDDLMLETYTLKSNLDTTRQELSQALYQQDASSRVIARLVRERDEALGQLQAQRAALAQAATGANSIAPETPMEVEVENQAAGPPPELSEEVMNELQATWKTLTKARKKRAIPEDLTPLEGIQSFKEKQSWTLHRTTPAGITCLSLGGPEKNLVLTGGVDKSVILFDHLTGVQVAELEGHEKRVFDVGFCSESRFVLSASADGIAKVWSVESKNLVHNLTTHSSEVTSICGHPTGKYVGTAGRDKAWALHDLETGKCLRYVAETGFESGYENARWHPDGLILGTGTGDAQVRIWDMKNQKNVATFKGHEGGVVGSLAFSENGYYMASGGSDGTARLWDLRKLKNFHTIEVGAFQGSCVKVQFDLSGTYLGVAGGKGLEVHVVKGWSHAVSLGEYSKAISGVEFGPNAKFVVACAMDRTLRTFD
eukprot:CAMPEP_0171462740 /NCGR_PEP_ID=MMETSP0945-20130129/6651_1 /TAXON_ID=109269 /ORGANISM="Vaucheria litorea, Strain CCMP2940" /LENGTH=502 /DNA_ID=CAMNT_0011989315 /DNA_START=65 /DNA_END=1573 /DNA_ORIENTATION=+